MSLVIWRDFILRCLWENTNKYNAQMLGGGLGGCRSWYWLRCSTVYGGCGRGYGGVGAGYGGLGYGSKAAWVVLSYG
ncbi:hypothetical protein DERP_008535 [Dermatophagoides pteronyssinus]|uniref:Uncharacterized protein n=1 Tax=Dermatophagoides pteronyssinus TaxID=6956 RepID=A0ABQ8IWL5_DERPT|nr:hypothetical protein DERP_008535 [Dermatophagoides pteronyssinus]